MSRRLTVNLSDDTLSRLRYLATKNDITMTHVLKKAIDLCYFIEEDDESKILIEDKEGNQRELLILNL